MEQAEAQHQTQRARRTLSLEERSTLLAKEIITYVDQGWRVLSQTPTTAQLVRDKRASCLVASLLGLLLILPAVLYLLLYRGTESLYLDVREDGQLIEHR